MPHDLNKDRTQPQPANATYTLLIEDLIATSLQLYYLYEAFHVTILFELCIRPPILDSFATTFLFWRSVPVLEAGGRCPYP